MEDANGRQNSFKIRDDQKEKQAKNDHLFYIHY